MEGDTITIDIPKKQYDFLIALSEQLKTQNNRSTADPLYLVMDVQDVVIDEDYSPTMPNSSDIEVVSGYVDKENTEHGLITAEEIKEYAKQRVEDGYDSFSEDNLQPITIAKMPYAVNAHLTDEGAKLYISQNKHNLNKPYTYAISMYRCWEMIELRKFLIDFK